jgi:hypothetical protein
MKPFIFAALLFATELVVAITPIALAPAPAGAQFFDDRFPFQNQRQLGPFDWFESTPRSERAALPDYSRAPAADAVALPAESKTEATIDAGSAAQPGLHTRPLYGPTVPLTGRGTESEQRLDGESLQPPADALAEKVLVRGEAIPAPAGRADDFALPRRDVAAVGSDPVVTTADLPMIPMVTRREGIGAGASSAEVTSAAAQLPKRVVARRTPRHVYANAQWMYRPDYRRQLPFLQAFRYQSMFGSRW